MSFKPKVLVIQSEAKLLKTISEVLTTMGAEAVAARESKHGAELITTQKFDGFFLDRQMPGIDGLQLTRLIRASEHNKQCPIVVLSDAADSRALPDSFKSGANFFLQKPVTPVQVRRLLNASRGMMLEERRRYQRAPGNFDVFCRWGVREIKGKCVDISTSGLQVHLDTCPAKGEEVEIEFAIPGIRNPFKLTALATRVTPEKRVGLHFVQPSHEMKKAIMEYADRVLGSAVVGA